jgi:threonine aldolase
MVDGFWRGFASDNYAGIHPEILKAMGDVNAGHQVAYGDDVYTEQLSAVIKKQFGNDAEAFPVFNGTGANVMTLQAMCKPWEAVVCATSAHINVDEGGAPEKVETLIDEFTSNALQALKSVHIAEPSKPYLNELALMATKRKI